MSNMVLVLGAGASVEAGLPTGDNLKTKIASMLNFKFRGGYNLTGGDPDLVEALSIYAHEVGQRVGDLHAKAHQIRDGITFANSIDNYIHMHRGDPILEACGKIAITESILKAERGSKIAPSESHLPPNLEGVATSWYSEFARLLFRGCTTKELRERFSQISVVSFNYDRCFEHYLYHALQKAYQMKATDAALLVSRMKIYHPYGSVGQLDWYIPSSDDTPAPHNVMYGAQLGSRQLVAQSKGIKTFTESMSDDDEQLLAIRKAVAEGNRFLFLGFAFHPQNMDLLFGRTVKSGADRGVLATTYKVSEANTKAIRHQLSNGCRFGENIFLGNLTSGDFIRDHAFGLVFS